MLEGKALEEALNHDVAQKSAQTGAAKQDQPAYIGFDEVTAQYDAQQAIYAKNVTVVLTGMAARLAAKLNALESGSKDLLSGLNLLTKIVAVAKDAETIGAAAHARSVLAGPDIKHPAQPLPAEEAEQENKVS